MSTLKESTVQELRIYGRDFLSQLIDLYLKESGRQVPELRTALEAKDAAKLEKTAHTLKGSSGNLGAEALSKLCSELQTAARGPEWERCGDLTGKAEEEYAKVVSALEAEKSKA